MNIKIWLMKRKDVCIYLEAKEKKKKKEEERRGHKCKYKGIGGVNSLKQEKGLLFRFSFSLCFLIWASFLLSVLLAFLLALHDSFGLLVYYLGPHRPSSCLYDFGALWSIGPPTLVSFSFGWCLHDLARPKHLHFPLNRLSPIRLILQLSS